MLNVCWVEPTSGLSLPPPKKKVFPTKKVNTHCKSRSDRLRMCPKHMIKKIKDVNQFFLVNVTLTSTNAKNPMSLSIYYRYILSKISWVHHGVLLKVSFLSFFPHLSSTSIPPQTTARLQQLAGFFPTFCTFTST